MAKISSLLLLVLAIAAASSIDAPAAEAAVSDAALQKATDFLKKWNERIDKASDFYDVIDGAMEDQLLPGGGRGGGDTAAVLPTAASVDVVNAGGMNFSVAGVDVMSPVTLTSQCGAGADGSRLVPCGDSLCKQYGGRQQPKCGAGAAQFCSSAGPDAALLQKGKIALITDRRIFSSDEMAYACRPPPAAGGASGSGNYAAAVIGLGRDGNIASKFQVFTYLLDSNLRSTLWLSTDAAITRARGTGRTITIPLGSQDSRPNFYYVGITGVKVGDGVAKKNATVGIMATTMPFTFLSQVLFDHIEEELSAVASSPAVSGSDLDGRFNQLCYAKDTKLPAITLVFNGDDVVMKLKPEHYSYTKSNGTVCLSILRSPVSSGLSVIGSMLQVGRRMTYDLGQKKLTFDDNTVAFDASSSKASPSPSPSAAQAAQAPVFLMSSAWVTLLLAIVM